MVNKLQGKIIIERNVELDSKNPDKIEETINIEVKNINENEVIGLLDLVRSHIKGNKLDRMKFTVKGKDLAKNEAINYMG